MKRTRPSPGFRPVGTPPVARAASADSTTRVPVDANGTCPRPRKRESIIALTQRRTWDFFAGRVSRSTLLTRLLPLSFATFLGTLLLGILWFPVPFLWQKHVLSDVISPRDNPEAYWLPSIGIVVSVLLTLPFAGYVERRLVAIDRLAARWTSVSFALGLLLLAGAAVPLAGFGRLHARLAGAAAGAFAVGMLCCSAHAIKDRFRGLGGHRLLCGRLSFCWVCLPLMPIVCGIFAGIMLLGRKADQGWALHAADVLRSTMYWQLAFWEWVGLAALLLFLVLSVLWLPEPVKSTAPFPAPAGSGPDAAQGGGETRLASVARLSQREAVQVHGQDRAGAAESTG